jgi:tetratricopeptide (TPR) repeat protein
MQLYVTLFLLFLASIPGYAGFPYTTNDFIRVGESYRAKLDFNHAIVYFSKAIEDDQNSVEAYMQRARTYIMMDRYQDAMDDYRRAFEIDPDYVIGFFKKPAGNEHTTGETESPPETVPIY